MIKLNIDESTCIKCGRCVHVCPAHIFVQQVQKEVVGLNHIETCISCGHCVAICPTASVLHVTFPPEKVHKIDKGLLPSPEQILQLCKARRSNRAFLPNPVPEEMLVQILEAAHRAPTASNLQQVEFTMVTDPEMLRQISKLTMDVFASLANLLGSLFIKPFLRIFAPEILKLLPEFNRLKDEYKRGEDLILRKATAVIFIHTPKNCRFGNQDSNLAYQNASLMAESLGVAQFYTGFVCAAIDQDKRKSKLTKLLGIKGKIHAGMALGMPEFRFPNYIDKKEIKVNRL